eukprot:GHVR01124283.1.p1 GENE.GHVR01124283.1~~GHVR01124283.1.p1  ORF type:complete len:395 (+),score=109.39 GHVR01124283.1:17-1201(+)
MKGYMYLYTLLIVVQVKLVLSTDDDNKFNVLGSESIQPSTNKIQKISLKLNSSDKSSCVGLISLSYKAYCYSTMTYKQTTGENNIISQSSWFNINAFDNNDIVINSEKVIQDSPTSKVFDLHIKHEWKTNPRDDITPPYVVFNEKEIGKQVDPIEFVLKRDDANIHDPSYLLPTGYAVVSLEGDGEDCNKRMRAYVMDVYPLSKDPVGVYDYKSIGHINNRLQIESIWNNSVKKVEYDTIYYEWIDDHNNKLYEEYGKIKIFSHFKLDNIFQNKKYIYNKDNIICIGLDNCSDINIPSESNPFYRINVNKLTNVDKPVPIDAEKEDPHHEDGKDVKKNKDKNKDEVEKGSWIVWVCVGVGVTLVLLIIGVVLLCITKQKNNYRQQQQQSTSLFS